MKNRDSTLDIQEKRLTQDIRIIMLVLNYTKVVVPKSTEFLGKVKFFYEVVDILGLYLYRPEKCHVFDGIPSQMS